MVKWFWRRRFLHFVNVFWLFRNYLPLEKGGALHLNKFESPSPKDALCQVWLKLAQWFLRRRFLNFVNVFSPFCNYLPLKKSRVLHLNKLESPSPKDALCQVWLKLAHWFWRRRFLKVVNLFLLFPNYLPFGKSMALHLNKLESPSPRGTFLARWFWWRRCEKFTDRQTDGRTDGQTDDGWQMIRKVHFLYLAFSSGELKIKRTQNLYSNKNTYDLTWNPEISEF